MNTDRFKNYQEDVKQLVLDFEAMERRGASRYFDVDLAAVKSNISQKKLFHQQCVFQI